MKAYNFIWWRWRESRTFAPLMYETPLRVHTTHGSHRQNFTSFSLAALLHGKPYDFPTLSLRDSLTFHLTKKTHLTVSHFRWWTYGKKLATPSLT